MMETLELIVNLAINNGMAIAITVYFLLRDWKYQQTLVNLLGSLTSAVDRFNNTIDGMATEALKHE